MRRSFGLGLAVALGIASITMACPARADLLAFTAPGGLTTGHDPGNPVNLGMQFTANTTFTVTSLGIYADPGVVAPEQVGLYDNATQTLLASTTVGLTDPETDGYLFHAITPVVLTAGHDYTVVANVGDNSWSFSPPAPIVNPDVSFIQSSYLYGNTLAFPTNFNGFSYYGPNFAIAVASAVPEPGSAGLAASGVALLWAWRRRRRNRP